MTTKESIEQLKSLIEHFNNGGNDFNATDIVAIQFLLEENKQLKTQLSGTTFCYDEEEHQRLKEQQKEFIKYLEDEINNCTKQDDIFFAGMQRAFELSLRRYKEIVNASERK